MLSPLSAHNGYNDNPEISGFYSSDDEAQAPLVNNSSLQLVLYNTNKVTHNNDTCAPVTTPKIKQQQNMNKKNNTESQTKDRWYVLILLCIQSISIWYSFDTLTILHNEFYAQLKFTDFEYNFLYSIAVFPSLILSFFAPFSNGYILLLSPEKNTYVFLKRKKHFFKILFKHIIFKRNFSEKYHM